MRCRLNKITSDWFDFVRLVRKSNSQQNRCSILFDCRTQSNTNRLIGFDWIFVRFCTIRYPGLFYLLGLFTSGKGDSSTLIPPFRWVRGEHLEFCCSCFFFFFGPFVSCFDFTNVLKENGLSFFSPASAILDSLLDTTLWITKSISYNRWWFFRSLNLCLG